MTRILILASFAPSLCNFRGALIEEMCRRGHEVHAAAPGLSADDTTSNWLGERGVTCHDVALSRSGLNPIADLKTLGQLVRLMRQIGPDLFIGYTVKPVVWGLLAARIAKVPRRVALITGLGYAFTGTASGLRRIVRTVARTLYRSALRHATLVFFQNPDDRDEFNRLGLLAKDVPVRLVAGSGVDTEHFAPQPFSKLPMRFLLIARLLGDKGIREYVVAARHLRETWPDAEFHLVGGADPSPDGISEDEAKQWHEAGDVIWHGHLSDVRSAIAQAHVYVLPSYREGTPRTVLEAMSMGRPIITTDAPGCRQTVVSGDNGFLVPVKDATALADAMEHFLSDPALLETMGARARRMSLDVFDVRLVNASMLSEMGLD
ncbi:glycosyltransferase family 4 protein [uncultured Shimia sp.]|uniref:glycosyltransferase family 4 protein n=1 Tax=uncultured Shimia sp. TaxID=573152 RepID=UPI00262B4132|nr:glycosyltransferase family 4 protein [uncultured Shimia sp.]